MRFLISSLLLTLALATLASPAGAQTRNDFSSERLGWHLAMDGANTLHRERNIPRQPRAFTVREASFYESLEIAHEWGLKYIGLQRGKKLSPENAARIDETLAPALRMELRGKLAAAAIRVASYQAGPFTKDIAAARRTFEFAKEMGAPLIIADAPADSFELLDQLTAEYRINVAIPNHPVGFGTPWDPKEFLDASKGHSERIGVSANLLFWGKNSLDILKQLEGKVFAVSFRGVGDAKQDQETLVGGAGLKSVLAEMKRQSFQGPIFIVAGAGDDEDLIEGGKRRVGYFDHEVSALAP